MLAPEELQKRLKLIRMLEDQREGIVYNKHGKQLVPWEDIELTDKDIEMDRLNWEGGQKPNPKH